MYVGGSFCIFQNVRTYFVHVASVVHEIASIPEQHLQ